MFDLSQLDEDFSVPQVLRRNWMSQTGIDPMAATRNGIRADIATSVGSTVIVLSMSCLIVQTTYLNDGFSEQELLTGAGFLAFLCFGLFTIFGCHSSKEKEVVNAEDFAEALERLCEILNCGAADMALMSGKELRDKAECVLIERAGMVKQERENGAHFSADKFMVDAFNPAHELFLSFGLVEENYDRFFADQKEEEEEPEDLPLGLY